MGAGSWRSTRGRTRARRPPTRPSTRPRRSPQPPPRPPPRTVPAPPTLPDATQELAADELYDRLAASGYEFGPAFQAVRRVWRRDGEILTEVELDGDRAEQDGSFSIHPALLDAAL